LEGCLSLAGKFARALVPLSLLLGTQLPSGGQAAAPPAPSATSIGPLAHIQAPPASYRFPDATAYVYTAEWRLWTAGTTSLRLDSAGGVQRVTGTVESSGVVSLLYRVHDRFEAWFDPRTFCSIRLNKHTEEGFHKRETSIQYDYTRRKSVLDEVNLKSGERKHSEQDIPNCVTDVLSGIYYVASLPLQVGATYVFPLNDGGKTVEVTARVEAREQVKTDAGTFNAVRVQPEAASGVLKDRGRVWVWYSDDAQHIPVQMRARMFFGTLTMRLQRVERGPASPQS
jgi:hypothetical protein